jgi:hypothetical protein
LKWLLNERAALAGEMDRTQRLRHQLQSRAERLRIQLSGVEALLSAVQYDLKSATQRAQSLDAVLVEAYPGVALDAVGVVHAWAGRYGERGALTRFLRHTVQAAAPSYVAAIDLQPLVIRKFGLPAGTSAERKKAAKSINGSLRNLSKEQVVESKTVYDSKGMSQKFWRWVPSVTLKDLMVPAASEGQSNDRTSNPDPPGGQVVSQRASDARRRDGED